MSFYNASEECFLVKILCYLSKFLGMLVVGKMDYDLIVVTERLKSRSSFIIILCVCLFLSVYQKFFLTSAWSTRVSYFEALKNVASKFIQYKEIVIKNYGNYWRKETKKNRLMVAFIIIIIIYFKLTKISLLLVLTLL